MIGKLPHEIKSEETKKKILDATEKILSQYDFKYLTVRNICEEAGVAYGSFYHHFTNKENLLDLYTYQLFQETRAQNPVPDWIAPSDYIKNCLWYILVYGIFCEALGKDLVKYLYTNSSVKMFEGFYQEEIFPQLEKANMAGYLDPQRNHISQKGDFMLVAKDLKITCTGVLLWWSNNNAEEDAEPLHVTLDHLSFNMLFSWCSELYRNADYPHYLLTESSQFEGSIIVKNVFTQKKQS